MVFPLHKDCNRDSNKFIPPLKLKPRLMGLVKLDSCARCSNTKHIIGFPILSPLLKPCTYIYV